MTADINIQNKPVITDQIKPVLKAVNHPQKDTKTEADTALSIKTANANSTEKEARVSQVEKEKDVNEEKQTSEQQLDNAVKQLNTYVQSINRNLEFNIDNESGKTIVKVIDSETDELIRQIPNEEALLIAKQLNEQLGEDKKDSGLLLIKAQA